MEQVKAEPVAWMYGKDCKRYIVQDRSPDPEAFCAKGWLETPLYATPQPAAVDGLVEKLAKRAFVLKEPHLSGHRICIGFEHEQDSWEAFKALTQALAKTKQP